MSDPESLKDIQEGVTAKNKWGGARSGAGRSKHSKNKDTIEREEAARQFKERVAKNVDRLFNSQLDLALGEKYLMVKRVEGEGKNRKTWIEIVTNTEAIKKYLDDDGESLNEEAGEDYYYMTTKAANNMALEGLLNRAFGKATEKMELDTNISGELKTPNIDPVLAAEFVEFTKNKSKE